MKKKLLIIVLIGVIILVIARFIDFSSTQPAAPEAHSSGSRLFQLLSGDRVEGYSQAIEARTFRFPEDHGPHPDFRNEWWYLTGNLDDERGERFGFELTFFRFALNPGRLQSGSHWQSNQVYLAHFAVTDAAKEQFHVAQRFSRGALELAGAQTMPFKVWIDDWSIKEKPAPGKANQNKGRAVSGNENWELTASTDGFPATESHC